MYVRRKEDWKTFRVLAMEAMEGAGLTWKVETFGVLWNARVAGDAALGSCLIAVEMANGLRRTNAMVRILSDILFASFAITELCCW